MDEATLKKIILLMMERDALDNLIFEQTFQKKIISKFKNLSKNQPMVIKIIGMEGEIMPSTIGKYTGMEKVASQGWLMIWRKRNGVSEN